jgi:hypothetical protein
LKDMAERHGRGEKVPASFATTLLHRSGALVATELAQSRTTLYGQPVIVTRVSDIS